METMIAPPHPPLERLTKFELPHRFAMIRPLREDDNLALEWQGGVDLRTWYGLQWERHLHGDVHVLVVDYNGFPIAQSAIHWSGKPSHPLIPDIQSLRVFPAFRGMGIGSHLLNACEDMVRERGFSHVSLAVALENPRARSLYERVGYQAVGEPYDDIWHYVNQRGEVVHLSEVVIDLVKDLR
ncbi:MAG TPA: GNAT family N-acetyltransferase [Abditibacteriaceae bacterium]|jgi:ribosomal protein S18 acetylase RimI-like enzyme